MRLTRGLWYIGGASGSGDRFPLCLSMTADRCISPFRRFRGMVRRYFGLRHLKGGTPSLP